MSLARFAVDVNRTRGRRWPELSHPYRNEYARDRDRVIHSRAFRRLEAKTQVFTTRYSDHFRNRLTHTIEVTQIARTVAGALELNADLAEALALAHDLGHPPFGHAGERSLDGLMSKFGERFDHNLHALRIVERFEQRYLDFPGLNLTFEVREGIVKHSRDYPPELFPELAEYRLDLRPSLEAQLIDAVDEIAYNCADLDDGVEAKLLDLDLLFSELAVFADFYRDIERSHPSGRTKLKINEAIKRILDFLATDLIENTRARVLSEASNLEDVLHSSVRLAGFSGIVGAVNSTLKQFLYRRLYNHPQIIEERDRSVEALERLFHYYLDHPEAMPEYYAALSERQPVHRVVCDYIAGMTDQFLLRQHRSLIAASACH